MPLIHQTDQEIPSWCELRQYEIVHLPAGATRTLSAAHPKQKLIVCEGRCRVTFGDQTVEAEPKSNLDLRAPNQDFVIDNVTIDNVTEDVILVHMAGNWGDETGGSGLFKVITSGEPQDRGDPVSYEKSTNLDRHYHDCDEYWIFYRGRGTAVSEGKHYPVGPGDCIATGMGHHHDFPLVEKPVHAVYFETTLEGEKRRGHLWEHTHGPASPKPERV